MNQQERISETIAEMNRDREREAATKTRKAIENITSINAQIRALQASLVKAREELASITYEPVNAADIVG